MAFSLASRTTTAVPAQRRSTVSVKASSSAAPSPRPRRAARPLQPTTSAGAASVMHMAPQAASHGWISMLQLFFNKQEQQGQTADTEFEAWLAELTQGEDDDSHSHSMYGSHLAERMAVEPRS